MLHGLSLVIIVRYSDAYLLINVISTETFGMKNVPLFEWFQNKNENIKMISGFSLIGSIHSYYYLSVR